MNRPRRLLRILNSLRGGILQDVRLRNNPAAKSKPLAKCQPRCEDGLTRMLALKELAVTVRVAVPPGVTLPGFMEQFVVVSVDETVHVRFTPPENPASPVIVSRSVIGVPEMIARLALCAVTRKSGLVGPFHAAASAPTSIDPSPVVRS